MEENNQSFNIFNFFRYIISKWKIFVSILVAFTLLVSCYICFFYNKGALKYSISFSITIDNEKNILPNGSEFIYTDLISEEIVDSIITSQDALSVNNVNKETLLSDNNLSISKTIQEAEKTETTYTLTAQASAFDSKEIALVFLQNLALYPTTLNTQYSSVYFLNYDNGDNDYSTYINCISNQYNFLVGKYNDFIETYSENYIVNGHPLKHYKSELSNWNLNGPIENLSNELAVKKYSPKNEELLAKYETSIEENQEKIAKNNILINSLKDARKEAVEAYKNLSSESIVSITDKYDEEIITLVKENAALEDKNNYYKALKLNAGNADSVAFENKIKSCFDEIKEFTVVFDDNYTKINENKVKISFNNSSIMTEKGQISILMAAIITVIVVSLALAIGFYIAYNMKKNVEQEKQDNILKNNKE